MMSWKLVGLIIAKSNNVILVLIGYLIYMEIILFYKVLVNKS